MYLQSKRNIRGEININSRRGREGEEVRITLIDTFVERES